ncbi:MAG: hypothetical protein KDC84_05835 [Crocinitomicaceae bacterium]|nr:hypothetical protein [Crocinitomicaceae bacterium]
MPEVFMLNLLSNGIVEINFDDDFYDIKVEHLMEVEEGMRYLGKGKKLPFFFNSKDFLGIDKDAVAYSKSAESGKFTLANAVLVDNQAKKLIYNFYFRIKPPSVTTKAFKTKEDAFEWLLSLPKE